jgi:hypothetical protein
MTAGDGPFCRRSPACFKTPITDSVKLGERAGETGHKKRIVEMACRAAPSTKDLYGSSSTSPWRRGLEGGCFAEQYCFLLLVVGECGCLLQFLFGFGGSSEFGEQFSPDAGQQV